MMPSISYYANALLCKYFSSDSRTMSSIVSLSTVLIVQFSSPENVVRDKVHGPKTVVIINGFFSKLRIRVLVATTRIDLKQQTQQAATIKCH